MKNISYNELEDFCKPGSTSILDVVTDKNHRLTFADYEQKAARTDRFLEDEHSIHQIRYGFFGEIGELLAIVKKASRDTFAQNECEGAREELGDALWYLSALIRRAGITLEVVGHASIVELQHQLNIKNNTGEKIVDSFDQIDEILTFRSEKLPAYKDLLLYKMAAQTGAIFSDDYSILPIKNVDTPPIRLFVNLLSSLAMVAAEFKLKLASIATENLKKAESRWPPYNANYISFFDNNAPVHERLPRQLTIFFTERIIHNKRIVVQQLNGVYIGDPLTDNRLNGDDYRYHDVFHLSYMAHLGWSPVIRGLLKLKRKSVPEVDENEDGARAMIIEEGISTWIFNHARNCRYYEGVLPGKLEYGLLKQIKSMVSGYEADRCPLWQWENAILEGFSVFRQLRDAKGGVVHVDMINHSLRFEQLKGPKR